MRKTILVAVSVLIFALNAWAAPKDELKVFIWSEYIDPQIPMDFEKKFGIKVRLDLYESNEDMLAKLQTGGVSQYDIIVPSDYVLPSLINLKLVMPLDHSKIPNIKNLSPKFRDPKFDRGNKYSVGWQWGSVGLMYNKDRMKNVEPTWGMLFEEKREAGPFLLLDDIRSMMGITLLYLGYDFNTQNPKELKEAVELLIKTKKRENCLGFKGGLCGKKDVVEVVAAAAVVYNGDGIKAVSEGKNLAFFIPREGAEINLDSMCIPIKAPNPEGAHKWINYILEPEVGAQLSNYNQYGSPNQAAMPFINPADKVNPAIYPTPETMKVLTFIQDLGKGNRLMDEAWTRVKSH